MQENGGARPGSVQEGGGMGQTMSVEEKIGLIRASKSFEEVRSCGILPEPDADDGYWFVSYSHKDYKEVIVHVLELRERGVHLWYDRGLETGRDWRENVRQKIYSYHCRGVLVFLSENFLTSQACQAEVKQIVRSKKCSLAVGLDGSESPFEKRSKYLPADSSFEEKAETLKKMPKPALYRYELRQNPFFKKKKTATLVEVNDKTIRRAVIPATAKIKGKRYKVREISEGVFANCLDLAEVIIPDGWSRVSKDAFINCFSLEKVTFGRPAKAFGILPRAGFVGSAFTNCISLKEVSASFPAGKGRILLIGSFHNCNSITAADLRDDFRYQSSCFRGCSGLEKAAFGRRQCTGEFMFADDPVLREVIYDPHCKREKTVQKAAFSGCVSLESVALPARLQTIDERAFEGCSALRAIQLPPRLKKIGAGAFAGSGLEEIVLPKRLTKIAADAFRGAEVKTVTVNCRRLRGADGKKQPLGALFPACRTVFLKRGSRCVPPEGFAEAPSEKRGYRKYVRREGDGSVR